MAQGVYSLKTLNSNWFEDRCQPEGSLTATAGLEHSKARAYETELAYIGERYDVLARISRIPPRPSYATPDDGFREKAKTSLVDFAHPRSRPEFSKPSITSPAMINTANAPVSKEDKREVPGQRSGFGAVLDRHKDGHDARFWNTANHDFYGQGDGTRSKPRLDPALHRDGAPSGLGTENEEGRVQGVKVGRLCGENFNEGADPGTNTFTQRAWLYASDASLRNVELGGTRKSVPETDNYMSLPLGKGAMAKVRADLKERKGRLARTATNITKGAGNKDMILVYQDDRP